MTDYKKYRKIDWRLRPPMPSFRQNQIFDTPLANKENPRYAESARKFSMDLLIKEMDEAGIEIGMVPYRATQQDVQKDEITEIKAKYPGRFKCMAHIDPYAEDPLGDIDDLINNGPADLAIIEPGQYFIKKPVPADAPVLYPIYEKCQKDNIVLTITFGGLYNELQELYNPIYIDRVAKDFPKLNMVLTHAAFPFVREIMHVCYQRKNVYISPDFYMSPVHGTAYQDYAAMANYMCPNQVIFGSVYPGFLGLKNSVDEHMNSGISEENLQKVFWDNAARLLGIE